MPWCVQAILFRCRGALTRSVWTLQCLGNAQPPRGVLVPDESASESSASASWAVSVTPSQCRRAGSPALAATASLRERLEMASRPSRPSSGVLGPGYYSGKALKWLGERVLDGVERFVVMGRTYRRTARVKRWGKRHSWYFDDANFLVEKEETLFQILEDALEMLRSVHVCTATAWGDERVFRPCYSGRVNDYAVDLGRELQRWSVLDPTAVDSEVDALVSRWQVCISPL